MLRAPALANVVLGDGYTNVAVVAAPMITVWASMPNSNQRLLPVEEPSYTTRRTHLKRQADDVVQDVVASGPDAVVLVTSEEGIKYYKQWSNRARPNAIQIYITDGMATGELGVLIDESSPGIASGMKELNQLLLLQVVLRSSTGIRRIRSWCISDLLRPVI